jgi:hypothetical protein
LNLLARWFFLANRLNNPPLSSDAAVLGIVAMLLFATLQILLLVRRVCNEQTLEAILTLTGLIG